MSDDHTRLIRLRYLRATEKLAMHNAKRFGGKPLPVQIAIMDVGLTATTVNVSVIVDMLIAKGICTSTEIEAKLADMMETAVKIAERTDE